MVDLASAQSDAAHGVDDNQKVLEDQQAHTQACKDEACTAQKMAALAKRSAEAATREATKSAELLAVTQAQKNCEGKITGICLIKHGKCT